MSILSFHEVSYWYPGTKEPCLSGLNLSIEPGELVLLSGQSGCGKSTLLHCIKGLLPKLYGGRMAGRIEIDGRDTEPLTVIDMATEVGLVMQDPDTQLCNLFVRDEVAFGVENLLLPREQCLEQVQRAIDQVGLGELADRQVFQLSGGQKQRVAIASVLAMDTPIILLDEPTANLDNRSGREIFQLVAELRSQGKTILLIQHELDELAAVADRLVILSQGRIAASGAPRAVFSEYEDRLTMQYGVGLPQVVAAALKTRSVFPFERLPLSPAEFAAGVTAGPKPDASAQAQDEAHAAHAAPIIQAEALSYRYPGMKSPAILEASFQIQEGEVVAICGKNGSGKSTLARLLVGLLKPTSGIVRLGEKNIAKMSAHELHGSTGYVFQFPEDQFLTDAVDREIAYGLEVQQRDSAEIDRLVKEVMQLLRLDYVADRHPFSLSGGEKRRLSVATMMILEPRLLILDEPTYGLDEGNLINLLGFLFERLRARGITIAFITHDMRLVAEYAQRALVMSEGRLVFDGRPADLFRDAEKMQQCELLPPPIVELMRELEKKGWRLPDGVITLPQFVDCLCRPAADPAGTPAIRQRA